MERLTRLENDLKALEKAFPASTESSPHSSEKPVSGLSSGQNSEQSCAQVSVIDENDTQGLEHSRHSSMEGISEHNEDVRGKTHDHVDRLSLDQTSEQNEDEFVISQNIAEQDENEQSVALINSSRWSGAVSNEIK